MNYDELIENVYEIHDRYTIIGGYVDLYATKNSDLYHIKPEEVPDCYWILIGKASKEDIEECLNETEYKVEKEGCYRFEMVLKYESPDYGDYGRIIGGGYYYVEYSKFNLDHTFEQRERDSKLNELIGDLADIFNI